jgi:formylglycine-generating enzyme required for sulfatase activity
LTAWNRGAAQTQPTIQASAPDDKPRMVDKLYGIKVGDIIIPETVALPHGTFTMGQPNANFACHGCSQDEQPPHSIAISAFEMGRFEVTNAQYQPFAFATGRENAEWRQNDTAGRENYPVYNVSWSDAQAYCAWLQAITGREYRLPTEAEWEYAARAHTSGIYIESDALSPGQAQFNDGKSAVKVGKFKPNKFGLYDVIGNVWEWCADWYDKDYYKVSPATDPQGPSQGQYRVLRGGGWNSSFDECRVTNRTLFNPGYIVEGRGIRVAATIKH